MVKPLFRWTVGDVSWQGLEILAESIEMALSIYGDRFDFLVCYNSLEDKEDDKRLDFIRSMIYGKPITLRESKWEECCLPDVCGNSRKPDGTFEKNGNFAHGTLWKLAPAKLDIDRHEIIMDNDIIILKQIPIIEEWLEQDEKVLVLNEHIKFYGRYTPFFDPSLPPYNSGLMGLPPNLDFGAEVRGFWSKYTDEKHEPFFNLSHAEEQACCVGTLINLPHFVIDKKYVREVLAEHKGVHITGQEYAIHMAQANRIEPHWAWLEYQEIKKKYAIF